MIIPLGSKSKEGVHLHSLHLFLWLFLRPWKIAPCGKFYGKCNMSHWEIDIYIDTQVPRWLSLSVQRIRGIFNPSSLVPTNPREISSQPFFQMDHGRIKLYKSEAVFKQHDRVLPRDYVLNCVIKYYK